MSTVILRVNLIDGEADQADATFSIGRTFNGEEVIMTKSQIEDLVLEVSIMAAKVRSSKKEEGLRELRKVLGGIDTMNT
jgi:hypothetical protein